VHGALLIVHWNTFAPAPKAVIPEVGEEGVVIVPAPLTNVQVPIPAPATFPASVAVVPQIVWSGPAAAAVGVEVTIILTWSDVDGHGALVIVHWKVFVPTARPVIPEVGDEGVVTVPEPLISVHVPVPTKAVFPANVAVVPHKV
jgi:hypothetical protein